jgi:hypothetical protein
MAVASTLAFLISSARRQRAAHIIAGTAAVVVTGAACVVGAAAVAPPTMATCFGPADVRMGLSAGLTQVRMVGPYVWALAALGLFARRTAFRFWPSLAMAILVIASWGLAAQPPLPLTAVLLTVSAAIGLTELVNACGRGFGGRAAAAALVALAPLLAFQALRASPRPLPDLDASAHGHAGLSAERVRRLMAALPADAGVVSEDATTDLLIRASRPRGAVTLPRQADRMDQALNRGDDIRALPLAQEELMQLGYRMDDSAAGMAVVRPGGDCHLVTGVWRSLGDLDAATAFTLVARTPDEAGPIVVYAAFDTRPALDASGWPTSARRGFYTTVYDLSKGDDRSHLEQDLADDGATGLPGDGIRAFVARLELWRTPAAPLRLTVGLGARPRLTVAHVLARALPRHLLLCPTYPHAVGGLGQ